LGFGIAVEAVDDTRRARNHGGMKRLVLALFLAWAPPVAGQAPSADWRAIVSERDRARIENWRLNLDQSVEVARQAPLSAWHGISTGDLSLMNSGAAVEFPLDRLRGRWRCRLIFGGSNHVSRNDWFHCGLFFEDAAWRVEKRSGQHFFAGVLLPDPVLGTVFVGADWSSAKRSLRYADDPDRNLVGVLRRVDDGLLRLMFSFEDYLQIVEIDIRHRLRARHLTAPGAKADSD
jgi:hypothetical protein